MELKTVGVSIKFKRDNVVALSDVSVSVSSGNCIGVVGESGSGKTTLGKVLCGILKPTKGKVLLGSKEHTFIRGKVNPVQMIYQDPFSSLPPHMTIADIITEPLILNGYTKKQAFYVATDILCRCGFLPEVVFNLKPANLSGGQRQRLCIARVMVLSPLFVIADEPTSMLDVSTKGDILLLLREFIRDKGVGMVFITHELNLIRHICEYVYVLLKGVVVEQAPVKALLKNPLHPYTKDLIEASNYNLLFIRDFRKRKRDNKKEFKGCFYYYRCSLAEKKCEVFPPLFDLGNGSKVRCWQVG